MYNDNYNPDLILAEGWTGTKTETPTSPTSITLDLTGFDGYLLFKWGNIDHFYFINDLVTAPYSPSTVIYNGNGSYTFLSDVTPHSNLIPGTYSFYLTRPQNYLGLSHYTKFDSLTTVPETTTFLAGWLLIFPFIASFIKHKKTGSV